jgi:pimeloyl-ACP methyl ester carboxylesterase
MTQQPLTQPPEAIRATAADLPPPVAAALAEPAEPYRSIVEAAAIPFSIVEWGDRADLPLLLIHGITSSTAGWWRLGPALAAAGFRVAAPDQAGHGRTGTWRGHHRFADNAGDVAALVRTMGLDRPDLSVVGHSWGAMTAAWLPAAGILPRRLVLLDPPAVPHEVLGMMVVDPVERRYEDRDEARRLIYAANPDWHPRDVEAKAEALTQFDEAAVRAVLLDNGDWDGGLAGLQHPAARDIEAWLVRGDPAAGSLVPDAALPQLMARVGSSRILTVVGGPHSPHRTRPEATTLALLRALGVEAAASR